VLEAEFILLEFPSPSRRIFIGSHSLPPLWFAVSVLQGVSGSYEAEDTWRDCMACVGRTWGATKAWPSDVKTHKHYINAPAWVVSPVVELGVVESFTTPAGPDI
jgi:hypothetical protein